MPKAPRRRLRRVLAAGAALAVASTGLVLAEPAPAEAAAPSVTVVATPLDPVGGAYSERYGRDADGRPANTTNWLTIDPSWVEVAYSVVGGSGGSVAYHLGGRGARIDGALTAAGQTLLLVTGGRGIGTTQGSSLYGYAGGDGASGSGIETNTGLTPHRDYRDGAGGGGASYVELVAGQGELSGTVLAVAAGGGGAAGGDGYAESTFGSPVCRGAAGGDAGASGEASPPFTREAGGAFGPVVLCVGAAGGRSGAALGLGYAPSAKNATELAYGPGAGGGGGGVDAGEAGASVGAENLTIENLTPKGGAAGGGGGGRSLVPAGAQLALDDGRGDGYIEVRWYVPHETTLGAQVAPGAVVASGLAIPFALELGVPADGLPAVAAGGTITATLDGEPVFAPGTTTPATGSIAGGIELVLPATSGGPRTLCFSLDPASAQLLPPDPACLPIEVPRSTLQTALLTPAALAIVPHPDCPPPGCVELPATAHGPVLHPVLRAAPGIDVAALATGDLDLTLTYRDLETGVTAPPLSITVPRATTPAGQPPALLPALSDGSVPFRYLDFPAPVIAGKVYELRIAAADTPSFSYAESPPLYVRVVHSPAPISLSIGTDPIETGQEIDLAAVIAGSSGPSLPLCCGAPVVTVFEFAPGGEFAVALERAAAPGVPLVVQSLGVLGFNQSRRDGTIAAPAEAGDYRLVLRFTSDDTRYGDQETSRDIVVAKAGTATTLAVQPSAPSRYGSSWVLESATALTGAGQGSPTGDVEFEILDAGAASVWSGTSPVDPATGLASVELGLDTRLLVPGTYQISATYGGDGGRLPSSGAATLTVGPAGVAMTLSAPDAVEYGGSIPWSSAVTADPVDGSLLPPPDTDLAWELVQGAAASASGTASPSETSPISMSATFRDDIDVRALEPGDYELHARFAGDGSYAPAAAHRDVSIVARETALALFAPTATGYSEASDLRVVATSTLTGLVPDGDVAFSARAADGRVHDLGTSALSAGVATLTTDAAALAWLVPGEYTLEACLVASPRFAASCADSALTVARAAAAVAVLSPSSVAYGDDLDVTVEVTWSPGAAPAGWMPSSAPTLGIAAAGDSSDGARGGLTLVDRGPGMARYSVLLATAEAIFPGSLRVGAWLAGDRFLAPAAGGANVAVTRMPVLVEVRVDARAGEGTVTATVVGSSPELGVPSGDVSFRTASRGLGTVALDRDGRASLPLGAGMIPGTEPVLVAEYGGSDLHRDGSASLEVPPATIAQLTTSPLGGEADGPPTASESGGAAAGEGMSGDAIPLAVLSLLGAAALALLLLLLLRRRRRTRDASQA